MKHAGRSWFRRVRCGRFRSWKWALLWSGLASVQPGFAGNGGPEMPPHSSHALGNGLKVLLLEQHEVPLVSFCVSVDAGSAADPAGKEGTAWLTAQLLTQGTRKRTAETLALAVDSAGGELSFEADADHVVRTAEFLAKDLALGLELLAETLTSPSFTRTEFEKLRRRSIDELKQAKDEPQAVIGRYFNAALFGAHPYGRPVSGDERSLASIRRGDVTRFYREHYGPRTTTLAVAGDFRTEAVLPQIKACFESWRGGEISARAVLTPPAPAQGRRLVLVDKPDATQTFFMIGNAGVARNDPDRVAIEAVNTAFGGRFTSMLNDALRVNSGLTYGARSQFHSGFVPGSFAISSYTRNAATTEAIDLALSILDRLHQDGLSEAQLRSVQAYLKGQFPPRIETNDQLAHLLVAHEFYGLDDREVNDYFARVDALDLADLRRVIQARFPARDLVFVLVGKAAEIRPQVAKYAERIEVRPITQIGFR